MGMEGNKTLHFFIYHPLVADHQTLVCCRTRLTSVGRVWRPQLLQCYGPLFCIVIYRTLLGWVSLWMSVRHSLRWHCMLGLFLKIY